MRAPKRAARDAVQAGAIQYTGGLTARDGLRFAVVVARFNSIVTKLLLEGALEDFQRHGVPENNVDVRGSSSRDLEMNLGSTGDMLSLQSQVAWVPGSFELPVVASSMARSGKYDAIVCIGTIVSKEHRTHSFSSSDVQYVVNFTFLLTMQMQGSTAHYDAVVSGATSGVLNSSFATGK